MYLFRLIQIIIYLYVCITVAVKDPYKVLGVSQRDSIQTIKRAYKKLAKEWHPDKTDDPSAQDKFIEINNAYSILSDPNKRDQYDRFGAVNDSPDGGSQGHPFGHGSPFEHFFHSGSFNGFHQFQSDSSYDKDRIGSKLYEHSILPKSYKKPYIILTYSEWCLSCIQTEPIWERLSKDLKLVGIGAATVHAQMERTLARKLSSSNLPSIAGIVEGRVYYHRGPLSYSKIIEFTRSLLPHQLLNKLSSDNYEKFLNDWHDNRIRVLFFSKQDQPKLRYRVAAYAYQRHVACGYVNILAPAATGEIVTKYAVSHSAETVLIFNENIENPVASLSMQEIQTNSLHDLIDAHKYLTLPRLSSQEHFEDLCPIEGNPRYKRICVVLISCKSSAHDDYRNALRTYAHSYTIHGKDRVRFAYIWEETQKDFLRSLSDAVLTSGDALKLALIWHKSSSEVQYDWLENGWHADPPPAKQLTQAIEKALRKNDILPHSAKLRDLLDEHAKGFISRMITKIAIQWENLLNNITKDDVFPFLSIVLTLVFILVRSYLMSYLMRIEEEKLQKRGGKAQQSRSSQKITIPELKGETYNGLLRLLKPGCRTVAVLVDEENGYKLVNRFAQIVFPYRRNISLKFVFVRIDRYIMWYKELLQCTFDDGRTLNLIPSKCAGTVLSLNGFRKYFCIYHPKVAESRKVIKQRLKEERVRLRGKTGNFNGDFLGMENSSSSNTDSDSDWLDEEEVIDDDLLKGLPNWLDRLFEGSLQRYYVDKWPEMGRGSSCHAKVE